MLRRVTFLFLCLAWVTFFTGSAARADDDTGGPQDYTKWTAGATSQAGLFTVWHKEGKVYLELGNAQLGHDFIQSAAPANGLGGWAIVWGEAMFAQTRLIRFTRQDNKIVITWPNTFFTAPAGSARQRSIEQSFAPSVVAVTPIVAEDKTAGRIVFDASPFLGDVLGMTAVLKQALQTPPDQAYRLDPERTYFGPTKAFPDNVIIDADQTFVSENPQVVDTVPDPRSIQLRIVYNLARPPDDKDYMPRLYDDRVGYVASPYMAFGNDNALTQNVNYILRWNLQPSDPSKPLSPAQHPIVFYLSNTIPRDYRPTIRAALLTWNQAFEKVGISDAVEVKDQPDDPNWDPDDIRYNVVRWVTEAYPSFGAEAQWVYDPRTGQLFHSGILIDAVEGYGITPSWEYYVLPVRGPGGRLMAPRMTYAQGMLAQVNFGQVALTLLGRLTSAQDLQRYRLDALRSTVLHESGHDMGFQHNFIGSEAYTARQLQDPAFTARMGIASTVMEYAPVNLWPKPDRQGAYFQTVLGPYDVYAIHWGYARIPGARTPADERGTLNLWAQAWSNPLYRFASDEDVSFENGHAIDPRVNQFDLTNDTLGWCATQLDLTHGLMQRVGARWPRPGRSFEEAQNAFGWLLVHYLRCDAIAEHFVAGEYLSRSHRGDPRATPPLVAVPRAQEQRAFAALERYLFSDRAWRFSPALLNSLVYQEQAPVWGGAWAYNPPARHDIPISEIAMAWQAMTVEEMFQPLVLQRLDDLALKDPPGRTMSLSDLFDWMQAAVYGDLSRPHRPSSEIRRNLQQWYARYLIRLWLRPDPGTPYDAQSLARAKLVDLHADLRAALRRAHADELTAAHLANLDNLVARALETRTVVPLGDAGIVPGG
jgi:hypothetical protein